ncbi:uncharacterized protein LOC124284105 [Haliotis rubra]|uniref:uncharacterized protein LOC124284105 n=1 Tax=Haliotis rubra TaxID=36100 RepID=UPI001EE6147B|nr:uncharacterized protein LOC124284105 [Haliotis rubra]
MSKNTFISDSQDNIHTAICRKPTHTDQYIHYLSNHHPQIKQAIIATLTRRAIAICNSDNLSQEIHHLKHTFSALNGYRKQLVEKTIRKTLASQQKDPNPKSKPAPSPILVSIQYKCPISHQISRLLTSTAKIDVTFTSDRTLKSMLHTNGKGHIQSTPNLRGCVYETACNCGDKYIGETSRPIATRIKEHKTSVEKSDMKSALSEHLIKNPDHHISWQQTKILHTNINHWKKRKLQESIEIQRKKPVINRDQGIYLPSVYSVVL